MNKFSIYAWPAYSTRKRNPYTYLIYKNIEEQGYPVHEFYLTRPRQTFKEIFSSKCKIFHLHWPHSNILKGDSDIAALKRFVLFSMTLRLMKWSGKKIVWTVHELEDHENRYYPRLKRLIDRLLYKKVDGFISMNQKLSELLKAKVKLSKNQQLAYISHPLYVGYYPNDINRNDARKKLGIAAESFVFLFLGQIRRYKNVPALIEAFKALNSGNAVLLIAGWVRSDELLQLLKESIAGSEKIKLHSAFVSDDEVQYFINAADLVVTPYRRIYNSGSVFLNLSFNKPTLGPDMYAISELKDALGTHWVKTYPKELTAAVLQKAMDEVIQEKAIRQQPNLDAYSPEAIAKETIEFYKSLLTA